MATQQSIQGSMKRAVSDVREGDLEGLKDDVSMAAQQAGKLVEKEFGRFRRTVSQTARQVSGSAKRHPGWTAGLMFGTGTVLGALLYGVLRPQPTGMELFGRGLKSAWNNTRGSFISGYDSLRRAAY